MSAATPGRRTWWIAIALLVIAAQAQAQQPPDAGTLLRQQPPPPGAAPSTAPIPGPRPPTPDAVLTGPRFVVKEFRFTGAVLISEAELQEWVSGLRDQSVNFGILQLIAEQLTGYYLQKGYLARVIVPEQEVKDGVVVFRVIEGLRGSLTIDNKGSRVDGGRVGQFINRRLGEGDAFSVARLDEALAILNEQPGVRASSSLKPGAREGEVAVVVSAVDRPLLTGTVGVNNTGGRASGQIQTQGSLSLHNPTGNFDAASLILNGSEGTAYARADYSLAVGVSGLRVGVNAAVLKYRVIEDSLRNLGLNGEAGTFGVVASYPLVRTRTFGLSVSGSHDVKKLVDRSAAGETGNREVDATNLGLNGNFRHRLFSRSALTTFGAGLTFGRGNQRNAGALAADAAGRRSNGDFSKLSYSAANLVELSSRWSTSVLLRGQLAGNNLDSTERLSLGGPSGVRAYANGEATGDEGWVLNVNLRGVLAEGLAASLFYDAGGITLNKSTWAGWNAGNTNLPNRYTLAGVGAGLDWRFVPAALLTVTVAVPVGSNPGRDANNNNADGRGNHARVSLFLNAQF